MRFLDRYPIIVTPHKDRCRDFWVRHFAFEVGFDSRWFVWLSGPEGTASLAFMTPDHPSAPPGPEVFSGKGLCLELQVADCAAALQEALATGLEVGYPLTHEPFGQKRFGFTDPSGLWVDVVEQAESAPGYWDRYMVQPA